MTSLPSSATPFLTSITFVRNDGTRFHPYKMKDRDTGRLAFRVSRGSTGSNTKAQTIFVDTESELRNHLRAGHRVRCRPISGGDANIYSTATPSIVRVEGL